MAFYETLRNLKDLDRHIAAPGKDLTFHAHLHESFELMCVLEGSITVQIENEEYRLLPGQQILILPNLIHGYRTDEGSLTQLVIFSVNYLPELWASAKHNSFRHPILNGHKEEFDRLLEQKDDHLLFRSLLYRIAAAYEKNPPVSFSANRNTEFTLRFTRHLEKHFTEGISEKSVAAELGYHPRYLSQRINRNFGVSFKVLLNEYRIREAKKLLSDPGRSITEVYTLSGFDSQNSFNRNFKAITGVTPREYRKHRIVNLPPEKER